MVNSGWAESQQQPATLWGNKLGKQVIAAERKNRPLRCQHRPTPSVAAAQPPPALTLAAPPPPSQPPPMALAAAARASLDASELQDFRGSKRDALSPASCVAPVCNTSLSLVGIVILCGRIIRGYAVLPGVDIRVMPVASCRYH